MDETHLSFRNIAWVIVWVGLGLALGLWVGATLGRSAATEYYAAYLLEKSLSVDNIFVFIVIFSELHIPGRDRRHRRLGFRRCHYSSQMASKNREPSAS